MGFRFQKRISIFPGLRINLSKSGVSASAGGHGATVNVGADGKPMVTLGVPGTGMSYRTPVGPGLVIVGILAVALLAGAIYLIAPDTVRTVLHWWQPRWF
jgi:hypothetical protein